MNCDASLCVLLRLPVLAVDNGKPWPVQDKCSQAKEWWVWLRAFIKRCHRDNIILCLHLDGWWLNWRSREMLSSDSHMRRVSVLSRQENSAANTEIIHWNWYNMPHHSTGHQTHFYFKWPNEASEWTLKLISRLYSAVSAVRFKCDMGEFEEI